MIYLLLMLHKLLNISLCFCSGTLYREYFLFSILGSSELMLPVTLPHLYVVSGYTTQSEHTWHPNLLLCTGQCSSLPTAFDLRVLCITCFSIGQWMKSVQFVCFICKKCWHHKMTTKLNYVKHALCFCSNFH